MKKFSLIFLIIIVVSFLYVDLASAGFPNWGQNGLVTCSGADLGGKLKQCSDFCDILATGKNILEFILTIALLVMAPVFLLIGGIMLIAGGANPGLHSKGVAYLKTTVIGIIIVLLSFAIVNTFISAFGLGGSVKGFSTPFSCEFPK